MDLRLATLKAVSIAAQCFNIVSVQSGFLCHICV